MTSRAGSALLPSIDELLAATRVVAIPTRTRFRGVSVREAAIIEGPLGWTEFSPFPEYDDAEAAAWLAAALEYGWSEPPAAHLARIEVNATVPAVPAADVAGILSRFPSCRTAKVKVAEPGQNLAEDVARVRAVREAMGDEARVRIDANGGWGIDEAMTALAALAPFGLDYAEQPVADIAGLAEVRSRLAAGPDQGMVRIAADESVRRAADPLAVARAGAADLLVVKAQPLGGIRRALEIIADAGLPVVVSSALDTSIGISMGARLAAALPAGVLDGACGLGTVALLAGDVVARPLVPEDGSIPVGRVSAEPRLLTRYAASAERERWWRDRIERCWTVLAERGEAAGGPGADHARAEVAGR
ncbi:MULTISPECIES: o-succinylbenzoate synthase [unclassified Leucobacter]|uniref:o-succinylbenzoate synthase n=1 Tax=unclassified Leucobacter TaxID=2621730 RepID=UPI00165DF6CE|nr:MULTISPECIES: o-succinylbenzoate synthase [unclassified Leucobacter]MBC9936083.1 o-succinylbenzoate synthase [Leucobacter sp. cx-87]